MRPLAIARFRLWTTVRAATPFFGLAAAGPIVALLVDAGFANALQASPDMILRVGATAAMVSLAYHAFVLVGIAHECGERRVEPGASVHPADLIDSAPISPAERSAGEFTGIFMTTLLIHATCLPILGIVAALSPLPFRFFAWFEFIFLALILLGSASASWRIVVLGTASNKGIRAVRNAGLFFLMVIVIAIGTTRPLAFRDGAFQFFIGPSRQAWARLIASVEHPAAMLGMFLALYCGYLAFYGLSAFGRTPQE